MDGAAFMALLIPIIGVSIPIVAIVTGHQRKIAEIRARTAAGLSSEVRAELSEIKNQLAELRETTTKFDMSFDAALTRLEERMNRVEQRQNAGAGGAGAETTLRAGRGIGA